MCGIVGFLTNNSCNQSQSLAVIRAMTDRMVHRGPDSQGHWCDCTNGIALGHRRLAVIDLSPEGHQPMISRSGRYIISYNGEIYNFLDLKEKLNSFGHSFTGGSDTEIILATIEQWGVEKAILKFSGMFAFALWDQHEKILTLARDRIGEKPLYYGQIGGTFLFGSELKALCAHPAWRGELNRDALHLLLRHTYIPAPHTIYSGVNKLLPGTFLQLQNQDGSFIHNSHTYWSAVDVAINGKGMLRHRSDVEIEQEFETLLSNVINKQMAADVPLGAFLSGGVDSSTIVALMQAQSTRRVKTFSIGFHDQQFNEAEHAKAIARHLNTEHTEFYVTEKEAQNIIPRLPEIYDEPFADSSQIPTCLLTKLARQNVTVALSGDGGDELFFGYHRYHMVDNYWCILSKFPQKLRHIMAIVLSNQGTVLKSLPLQHTSILGNRLERYADLIDSSSLYNLNEKMTGSNNWADSIVPLCNNNHQSQTQSLWEKLPDVQLHMMLYDLLRYLPDDILVKVDRAAMAASLETRIPLLDHSLVEYALCLPFHMKYQANTTKWLLRKILYKHVPRELIERPKMGFGVPIENWLRGPLRDWAESLLNDKVLAGSGMLNPKPIRKIWLEHQAGHNWKYKLWPILMFQAWYYQQQEVSCHPFE